MKFYPLSVEEAAQSGFTHRFDFSYQDFPAGIAVNTDYTINTPALGAPALPASTYIKRIQLHLSIPFEDLSDAAFNSTTIDIGDGGSATRYASGVQINKNGTEVIDTFPGATENHIYTADAQLAINFNSMADKSLSDLDKGKLYILFAIERANAYLREQSPLV